MRPAPVGHILKADQFSRQALFELCHLADRLSSHLRSGAVCNLLSGAVLANLFFEPSTRTRLSFAAAFSKLGGSVLDTADMGGLSFVKGEAVEDAARIIAGYSDCMVVRHASASFVERFACAATSPVINAGSGESEHPTQALADLYTIETEMKRHGRSVDGLKLAIIGDLAHSRTAHSLFIILSVFSGMRFTLASPHLLKMPRNLIDYSRARGHAIEEVVDLPNAIKGAAVIYMTRYKPERLVVNSAIIAEAHALRLTANAFRNYADPTTLVMHPMPRDQYFGELPTELDDLPGFMLFKQANAGLLMRMALFLRLFHVDHLVDSLFVQRLWSVENGVK